MDLWIAASLFAVGFVAGVLGAIAGGATFFTFPFLIYLGLPPLVANVTNFTALVPANVMALPAFRRELKLLGGEIVPIMIVAGMGGLAGSMLLIHLGGGAFTKAVPYLMAFATVLFAAAPYIRKALHSISLAHSSRHKMGSMVMLFVFSVYGGYFGAGLGPILLASLVIMGYSDFHVANGLKNALISAISLFSVIVYSFSGEVNWEFALVMMIGSGAGGFSGGTFSKFIPQVMLRTSIIVFGVFLTALYFFKGFE